MPKFNKILAAYSLTMSFTLLAGATANIVNFFRHKAPLPDDSAELAVELRKISDNLDDPVKVEESLATISGLGKVSYITTDRLGLSKEDIQLIIEGNHDKEMEERTHKRILEILESNHSYIFHDIERASQQVREEIFKNMKDFSGFAISNINNLFISGTSDRIVFVRTDSQKEDILLTTFHELGHVLDQEIAYHYPHEKLEAEAFADTRQLVYGQKINIKPEALNKHIYESGVIGYKKSNNQDYTLPIEFPSEYYGLRYKIFQFLILEGEPLDDQNFASIHPDPNKSKPDFFSHCFRHTVRYVIELQQKTEKLSEEDFKAIYSALENTSKAINRLAKKLYDADMPVRNNREASFAYAAVIIQASLEANPPANSHELGVVKTLVDSLRRLRPDLTSLPALPIENTYPILKEEPQEQKRPPPVKYYPGPKF